MASIKTLFDKITIIRPEKIGLLGQEGLEQDLFENARLLVEEIWESLPLKEKFSMPIIDGLPLWVEDYASTDILQTHLSSINESINTISKLLQEIQKRTNLPQTKLKKSTKMPQSLYDCQIDSLTGKARIIYSPDTGKTNIEEGCEAMGVPCSMKNLLEYGEILFHTYKQAAVMIQDFVTSTASMIMTEDEIKELTNYNEFEGVFLHSLYDDDKKLKKLCDKLINCGYLEKSTAIDDFIYFFSGKGKTPNKHLNWIKSNIDLAIFLDCYFIKLKITPQWTKAQKIFDKKNLKQSRKNTDAKNYDEVNKINNLFNSLLESI